MTIKALIAKTSDKFVHVARILIRIPHKLRAVHSKNQNAIRNSELCGF
jgi:hypothetical protein